MAFEPQEPITYSGCLSCFYSLILLMVSAGFVCTPVNANESNPTPFTVYTYHDKPPYFSHYRYLRKSVKQATEIEQIDTAEGLYPAFIELLNQSQQHWSLSLKHLPRKRLQLRLDQNRLDGAVIGVNPLWFSDKSQIKYLWSAGFINDRDVIAVKGSSDIKYTTLEDLHGLKFAVPRGWYFAGISEKIDQDLIQSFETSSDIQNLKLIAQGRVDATVISLPTLLYFQSRMLSPGALSACVNPTADSSVNGYSLEVTKGPLMSCR
ncbi:MAG: hypothetical protein CL693_10600 [Cellvibrionaceae bacterium]|nr:hypothetical protein [Cellvibrionaceae bacterium]